MVEGESILHFVKKCVCLCTTRLVGLNCVIIQHSEEVDASVTI